MRSILSNMTIWAYRRLDECRLSMLLIAFVGIILAFGVFYTLITPYGNGIIQAQGGSLDFGLLDGLYFSVVTVSSLGYGDMQPVGYSRIAAAIEVLLGLGFIGIMIAKLTSRPIAHLVSRVFVSTTRNRLTDLAESFHSCANRLWQCAQDREQVYPSTPQQSQSSRPDKALVYEEFQNAVLDLHFASRELRGYIDAETSENIFYRLVPTLSLLRLSVAIDDAFNALSQFIASLPTRSYPEIYVDLLNRSNMKRVSEAKSILEKVCKEFTRERRYGRETAEAFQRVKNTCDKVPDSVDVPVPYNPPDQMVNRGDEPVSV